MANEHQGYSTAWTLVAATPEELHLDGRFKTYRLTDLSCRVFRPVDMGGEDHQENRLNLLLENTRRAPGAKIAGAKIG